MKTPCRRLALAATAVLGVSAAQAETPDEAARATLKRMADYVTGLKALSFSYEVALEAVTTEGFKLQFPASGELLLKRPGQYGFTRTGAYADLLLTSDGEKLTLHGRRANLYAQKDAPESLDAFVENARDNQVELTGADLLLSNLHEELSGPVTQAMYLDGPRIHPRGCLLETAVQDFSRHGS